MSDFEVAIKQEFVHQFPAVKPKGCSFHFSKAIITKVQKSGFKADYARKENIAFRSFTRAIGLVYCRPLERFKEEKEISTFLLRGRVKGSLIFTLSTTFSVTG